MLPLIVSAQVSTTRSSRSLTSLSTYACACFFCFAAKLRTTSMNSRSTLLLGLRFHLLSLSLSMFFLLSSSINTISRTVSYSLHDLLSPSLISISLSPSLCFRHSHKKLKFAASRKLVYCNVKREKNGKQQQTASA